MPTNKINKPDVNQRLRPTASDVAKLAGVSTATVSRYFSDPDRIRKTTASRISNAIESLNYVPDMNAKALASRRNDVVGMVVPTLENAIFAEGVEALQAWLNKRNITLLVASSGYNPYNEYHQVQRLISHGVSGLVLIGTARLGKTQRLIKSRNIPYCLSWCFRDDCDDPQIGFDNYSAGAAMAQEIIDLGHKKIGILSGIRDWNDRATDRVQGALDRFESVGLSVPPELILESQYNHLAAGRSLASLLSINPDLSCIFCANDVLAAGAIKEAHKMNKVVPRDLSITGFDDIAMAQILTPALTTVRLRHKFMGEVAGECLLEAIESSGPVKSVNIPFSIVKRESLGPFVSGQ